MVLLGYMVINRDIITKRIKTMKTVNFASKMLLFCALSYVGTSLPIGWFEWLTTPQYKVHSGKEHSKKLYPSSDSTNLWYAKKFVVPEDRGQVWENMLNGRNSPVKGTTVYHWNPFAVGTTFVAIAGLGIWAWKNNKG
jgi:hypothetical protein